jgi:hypothetical protein
LKHEVQSPERCLFGHVVFDPVGTLAGHLTVVAGVFAAKGRDEDVELREAVEEAPLGSILRCERIEQRRRLVVKDELTGAEPPIEVGVRIEIAADYGAGCAARRDQVLAGFIDEYLSLGVERDEAEREQMIG